MTELALQRPDVPAARPSPPHLQARRGAPAGPTQTESDPRWALVAERDASADGRFVYSVRTTGVYCRPSCASRLARRENVAFHATCAEAEAAGFRPCRRCRPSSLSLREEHTATVANLCRTIEEAEEEPSLATLGRIAGLSPHHLHRVFKALTGLTPKAYARAHRARAVRAGLGSTGSVTEAIYAAGYGSGGRFYEEAGDVLGMTPTAFRTGGTQTTIRFAVGECSLGAILVAASGRGLCAILLGDDPQTLLGDLEKRFPKADLVGGDAGFEAWVADVVGFVEAPRLGLDLPLDIRGTAFQQRVWQALREIEPGETLSYAEVANRIGLPKSVRAVAGACAANALAVAIPCHRVVKSDGGLSGYRWGIERKRALLDRERGATGTTGG